MSGHSAGRSRTRRSHFIHDSKPPLLKVCLDASKDFTRATVSSTNRGASLVQVAGFSFRIEVSTSKALACLVFEARVALEVVDMGYTHYWRRERKFGRAEFGCVLADFARVVPVLEELGVVLAGPLGDGCPVVLADEISFNGVLACGHPRRPLGIAWPAPGAGGVCLAYAQAASGDGDVGGAWFAGRQLRSRSCDGDCSYESFWLGRVRPVAAGERPEDGRYLDFCKTAFKPYDLAVQVCLVIAAHHLGDGITVSSDGSLADWQDAIAVSQAVLGYGRAFALG